MGALEFMPSKTITTEAEININEISEVVKKVLDVKSSIHEKKLSDLALRNILKIGTSAGAARPKILISEHKQSSAIIAGDFESSDTYSHYLIKLAIDEESSDSKEKVEFVYYQLAIDLKVSHKDIQQLFKRMVFNLVFANIDDHLKNFSFIYDDEKDKWNYK